MAKENVLYIREKDSLSTLVRMPAKVQTFGISGNTVLALSKSGVCVADLASKTFKFFPTDIEGGSLTYRSAVWVFGDYMIYGSGSEFHVYETVKGIFKSFTLSEYVSDNRWVFLDGRFISASSHGLVSLDKANLDIHFR